ncbi:glycosyltransferase [Halorubrum sp. Atlit-28R]|uniref:glycosyltransferase n=1 Tax=Halorubrum sp. Atlit-28R TaxID=2282129 RepID=UPI0018F6AB52|nr:hypothetical protein [Halorubrum sp. Atlit-28R]
MLTVAKEMAADCTVIAVDHPESAADEVIADAGFLVEPTVDALTERLDAALGGARPKTAPVDHAPKYDWDAIATQAEAAYRRAIDGTW